jgi:hypothetical protein
VLRNRTVDNVRGILAARKLVRGLRTSLSVPQSDGQRRRRHFLIAGKVVRGLPTSLNAPQSDGGRRPRHFLAAGKLIGGLRTSPLVPKSDLRRTPASFQAPRQLALPLRNISTPDSIRPLLPQEKTSAAQFFLIPKSYFSLCHLAPQFLIDKTERILDFGYCLPRVNVAAVATNARIRLLGPKSVDRIDPRCSICREQTREHRDRAQQDSNRRKRDWIVWTGLE